MNLINATKLVADFTMFTDKTGREHVVVVAKGTYGIPARPDQEPQLLDEQVPLVMCDEFTGEPGFSAPKYEIDFAPVKPRCDVLLNGSAYAPGGKPAERVTVSLQVGTMKKSFDVVGNRTWKAGKLYQGASAIEPFVQQTISYDVAFGGVDKTSDDPAKHRWFLPNHAGKGYFVTADPKLLDGKPLPNTEETGKPITAPNGNYKPMAFGPVGRAWQPRIKWAGTYDRKWLDEKFPYFSDDFDERYFQSTPEDQQTAFLRGGEEVAMMNLSPEGRIQFRLPKPLDLPVLFQFRTSEVKEVPAIADTLVLEPDQRRFIIVWRAIHPIQRTIREIVEMIVGKTIRRLEIDERRRADGIRRFASLRELEASISR